MSNSAGWISVDERKPEGLCLVYLTESALRSRFHVALYSEKVAIIGGHFAFDMPKPTHWMPLPETPTV